MSMKSSKGCTECSGAMLKNTYIDEAPELLVLHIPYADIKISQKMNFGGKTMHLRGVAYYGGYHYMSRVIDIDKNIGFIMG
jgi:hypothetical protein